MPRRLARGFAVAALTIQAALVAGTQQDPGLRVVSAAPAGTLEQLADADQIRIVFSEPMVALGTLPDVAPPWVRIAPAAAGTFYWSGTKTLIFSPDASQPLPFATRFTVRIDGSAAALSGRRLGTPYELTFTTPTARLLDTRWYRATGRYDSPVLLALRFNQPVRPEDVVAHTRVAYTPHDWAPPPLSPQARAYLQETDPDGLAAYDGKVVAVGAVASSSDPVMVRLARSWDEQRFPPQPSLVVLETITPPPPDAWLTVTIDDRMPGMDGPETHPEQSTVVRLEPAFFARNEGCVSGCGSAFSTIAFTGPVTRSALQHALSVVGVSDGGERPVRPVRDLEPQLADQLVSMVTTQMAGLEPQPYARTWRFRLEADLEAGDGQTLGYPWVGFVENIHASPIATIGGSVWEAGGGPVLPVTVRNVESIREWLSAVTPAALLPVLRDLRPTLPVRPGVAEALPLPPVDPRITRLRVTPDVTQAAGADVGHVLSPAGTGLVWAATAPGDVLPRSGSFAAAVPSTVVQVTNLGITVKESPQSTLAFVTRLDTGVPVADAEVTIVAATGETRWRGRTDRDGVAVAPAMTLRQPPINPSQLSFVVTAEKDGDVAFVGSDWIDAQARAPRYSLNEMAGALRGSVFTDRGVYRTGDEVRVKAILRDDVPAQGVRPVGEGDAFHVQIVGPRGGMVERRTVEANRWSSAEWSWRVPEGAPLGPYRIEIARGGGSPPGVPWQAVATTVLVAAFRTPDFRVDATLGADAAVLGSTLHGTVGAAYLFGAALADRPVRTWFRRAVVHRPPDAIRERYPDAHYAVGYLPRPDQQQPDPPLPDASGTLGADGRLVRSLPTAAGPDTAYVYTFEGSVEAPSGQHIANRADLVVHPSSLYIALSRPPLFVADDHLPLRLSAVDLSGETAPGARVDVSLVREAWAAVRRSELPGAPIAWERREIPSGDWSVQTVAGEATLQVPVRESGRFIVRATARDAAGRPTRTEAEFYGIGAGRASWRNTGNRIELVPERTTWAPGERARILIQSPWSEATALLTTEREGIRSHRRFAIASTHDTVEVPITEDDIPNVFVSVLLVKGRTLEDPADDDPDPGRPAYRVGYTELTVDDASKRLRVEVSADAAEYRPRQAMEVSVGVAAPDGAPVNGEVTLWAVDYGLLSLTDYTVPDVVAQIHARKASQVMTLDNRLRLIRRQALSAAPDVPPPGVGGGAGGIGGGVFAAPAPPEFFSVSAPEMSVAALRVADSEATDSSVEVRDDFRPLVFWLGSAVTDRAGRASTTVTLPDSLTTYRIIAVAGDPASRFGVGEREVRVAKPLTLLPAFPRFMSAGDRAVFGAVVSNAGGAAGEAVVTMQSLDGLTLRVDGSQSRTVRLEPGASAHVTFEATAAARGTARVRMVARLGDETDAFEIPLVVSAPLREITTAAYGDTTGTAVERLSLPPGLLPDAGGLTVALASTALVGLGESARFVTDYPYECAEPIATRALALVLASDLGGVFHLPDVDPGAYREEAERELRSLSAYQCGGGFTLFAGRCDLVSPYLTAYILHVMRVASALGVVTDNAAIDRALNYLQQQLRQPPPEVGLRPAWGASQAYSVKVLAEYGRTPREDIDRLVASAEGLPVFALSYLADALAATGDRGPRYQDIVRRITNALRIEADRAHVEEVDEDALFWLWNTNTRATAVALDGFVRRQDDATFVAPLVRWLLAARTDGRWRTTHENGMALEALVAYYRAFERDDPRMTVTVRVGRETAATERFDGRSTTARQVEVSMRDLLAQLMPAATPADVAIARDGTGRVHYTARLQTFAVESPDAEDRGFQVVRHYEPYVEDGSGAPATSFDAGDLVRVVVRVTIRGEGRFLALTDPIPAGFEPVDSWFRTTATVLAREATRTAPGRDWLSALRHGAWASLERHDDRVVAYATRLASGTHELAYLVRATTAGTFGAAGTRVEAMYAPELTGRSAAATVTIAPQR